MKKAIVSLKLENRKEPLDLEVISDSSVAKMMTALCTAYNITNEKDYRIFADPPGRWLDPNETLEEAGVWDGAILTLKKII